MKQTNNSTKTKGFRKQKENSNSRVEDTESKVDSKDKYEREDKKTRRPGQANQATFK